jgi:NAD kinase
VVVSALDRKVILVTRKTRFEELVNRHLTVSQAKFYVEHLGADFGDYEAENASYLRARRTVLETLERQCRVQVIDRTFLPTFLFGPEDIVVALGQDGLVANAMKYLDGQPLVGVNPDPRRYDGVLLPFAPNDLHRILHELLSSHRPLKTVTMAKAALSDGQSLYAVNDLFVGPKSHTSARYEISLRDRKETQSSSGVIISTGLGSTAWMRSILTGAAMLMKAQGDQATPPAFRPTPWDAPYLRFAGHTRVRPGRSALAAHHSLADAGERGDFQRWNRKRFSGVHFGDNCADFGCGEGRAVGALEEFELHRIGGDGRR